MEKGLSSWESCHFWDKLLMAAKAVFLWCAIIILCSPVPALSDTTEKAKEKKTAPKLQSLMSNEELLKQATYLYNNASNRFLARLREVSKGEVLIDQARQKTESSDIPEEKPATPPEEKSSAEVARINSDHAKVRTDAFKHRFELVVAERTLLEKQIKNIETAQSVTQEFADVLEGLNLFLLEISLRVDDGTLPYNEIPDSLNEQKLAAKKQELVAIQGDLEQKAEVFAGYLKTAVSRTQDAKKAVIEAEADYVSAKAKYSLELKRQGLEKEYSGHAPEKMLAQLSELQEERMWLRAAFNHSHTRLAKSRSSVLETQQDIEALLPPEKTDSIQPEDVQQAAETVKKLDAYHTERIGKFRNLKSAIQSFVKQGQSFEGDATVLGEHIFKMQVIANILERIADEGKIKPDSIPEKARAEVLMDASNKILESVSESLAAVGKAKSWLAQIDNEIEKSEVAKKDARERLSDLEKNQRIVREALKWEETIKDLPAQELTEKFRESRKKFQNITTALKEQHKTYEKALANINETTQKMESLRDPLLRSAQDENLEEKGNILRSLYKFAKLELPDKKKQTAPGAPGSADKPPAEDAVKKTDEKSLDKETDKPAEESEESTEKYQNLLSTRVRIIGEQNEHRDELVNALNVMDQELEKYVAALTEARKTALQHNANALEIKKRLGKGELDGSEIPDGITEALKRGPITKLETRLSEFLNYHTLVRQQITSLGRKDETLKKIRTLLTDIQDLTGNRLDFHGDLYKLEQGFERKQEAISGTEMISLKQKAARHLESDDTKSEFFLGLIQSSDAKNLTELLKAYYLEIIELEIKQENLRQQKNKAERLIKIAEDEKTVISKVLPALKEQISQLEIEKEEELVKIKGRLMPQKAEELLKNFEAKTGLSIPPPPPVADRYKPSVIKKATSLIFDKHIRIAAAGKWISLFEQRLSPSGINAEIGMYQHKVGAIDAENSAIDRRIHQISGHSLEELSKMTPEERPEMEIGSLRFLEGEIGILRADRLKICTQRAIWIFGKTAIIIVLALLLTWITNSMSNRIVMKTGKSEKDPHTVILLTLLKGSFKFTIWIIAVVAVLDSLGFNVGTILAGFGIGGLAIAMASKETLGNVIGGINILIFKPFKVKDWLYFQDRFFEVSDINLCYTKLLNYNTNSPTMVPNAVITADSIMCYPLNQPWRMEEYIKLSIRNSSEKLKLAVDITPQAFVSNSYPEDIALKQIRVNFIEEHSFTLRLRYEIDFNCGNFSAARSGIHEEIVRLYQENGIEFADQPFAMVEGSF
ncbi:MAG: mechanosensitive ion channel [Desulfobacteraceae bacterium]|nr:mechanosensitive ion channel [Desulfobacteraceae bacterium]